MDNLIDCKQKLLFGTINEKDAECVMRIYLDSAKLSDHFQEKISSILRRQEEAVSFVVGIREELSKYSGMSNAEFEKSIGKTSSEFGKEFQNRASVYKASVERTIKDFIDLKKKLNFYATVNPDLSEEVKETLKPMEEMTQTLVDEEKRFGVFIEEQKLKKTLPPPPSETKQP